MHIPTSFERQELCRLNDISIRSIILFRDIQTILDCIMQTKAYHKSYADDVSGLISKTYANSALKLKVYHYRPISGRLYSLGRKQCPVKI